MMARMAETVILRNPNSGAPEVLLAGSEAPEWAVDQIGNKGLIEADKAEPKPPARRRAAKK